MKKIRILWWFSVVAIYTAYFILSNLLQWEKSTRNTGLLVLFILLMVSWYVVNQVWYMRFVKTVRELAPLLEEGHYDAFIEENQKLMAQNNGSQTKTILAINVFDAYCKKGDYHKGVEALTAVGEKGLIGPLRVLYMADLAYGYFCLGDKEEGHRIVEENGKLFDRYGHHGQLRPIIEVVTIMNEIVKEDYEEAKRLLEEAKGREEVPMMEDLMGLEGILQQQSNQSPKEED